MKNPTPPKKAINSMLRLNLGTDMGDSLNFNSTLDSAYEQRPQRDGMSSADRRERELERSRRIEAMAKRRGSGASPSKAKVSGGMSRKPNAIIKKLKEQEMLSINSSLRMSVLSNKLNNSIASRRESKDVLLSPAGEIGGSGSHMGSALKGAKAGTGTARSTNKTPVARRSSSKKAQQNHETAGVVSSFARHREFENSGHMRR